MPRRPKGGRGIALLFLNLSARRGWVFSTTPRPLYLQERPSTHCIGGVVGPRTGLDSWEKSRPAQGFNPWIVQPVVARSESLYRLHYPGHIVKVGSGL